jgi:hypothetical protein
MGLAIATLGAGQRTEFYRRRGKLTSAQRECLGKIFESIVDQGHQAGDKQDKIVKSIADFITQTVLGKGSPDYCNVYQEVLNKEYS